MLPRILPGGFSPKREIAFSKSNQPPHCEMELVQAGVTYPGAVPVSALKPVSLRVRAGEAVSVEGRSGSGKSTLLNILGLLDRPTEGQYVVRGLDTTELSEAATTALRARQFGFVFQSFHLLGDRSAAENVELGGLYRGTTRRERRQMAIDSLEAVGLGQRLSALPGTLSGGERQRVAIARALSQQPRVLLCDEPTGNLDRQNSRSVTELLLQLSAGGLTIVVATHDPQVAEAMSRRIYIDDGELINHKEEISGHAQSAVEKRE
jgi:putative ABC transport system ATP-binding protein